MAQLADQQAREEFLFAFGGLREQVGKQPRTLGIRSLATCGRDAGKARIDVEQREDRCAVRRGSRGADGGPANATAALSRQAGEIRNGNVNFIRCKAAQEIGDERDFCAPPGLLADTQRGVDEAGKRRGFDRGSQRVLP